MGGQDSGSKRSSAKSSPHESPQIRGEPTAVVGQSEQGTRTKQRLKVALNIKVAKDNNWNLIIDKPPMPSLAQVTNTLQDNPQNLNLDNQGLLHGDALIEAGGSDEDGEFSASDFDADDISFLSSTRSSSTSINSSILEHSYQNGRRYHRYRHGRYPLPNDEAEQNREDMLHAMMLEATDGRYFYAPIGDNPQKIADLGTGTGIWAIEGNVDPLK
ncbi:hypothetical protein ACHAP8_007707 [Fusarium lateritium]